MPEARIGGVGIHYSEVGEGEPLLLIMGFGMPGDAWLAPLPFLQGFRAIYFDNGGTGNGCDHWFSAVPRAAANTAPPGNRRSSPPCSKPSREWPEPIPRPGSTASCRSCF